MNRRKKGNKILKAQAKRVKAKLAPKNSKPKYISKAERAKLEAEANSNATLAAESSEEENPSLA